GSGGNEFHGSVFGDWRPGPGHTGDSGFELGGPIQRDRLWFFAGEAPRVASTRSEYDYVGKLTWRASDDHGLVISAFSDNATARYLGKLFDKRMNAEGALWFHAGDPLEGQLKLTNFFQAAGRHALKYGFESQQSLTAGFAQDS